MSLNRGGGMVRWRSTQQLQDSVKENSALIQTNVQALDTRIQTLNAKLGQLL